MISDWITIQEYKFSDCKQCIEFYKKNNIYVSPWIENIVNKYNFKFDNKKLPVKLKKIKVSDLEFKKATELKKIYKKIENHNLSLVTPEIAIYSRLIYSNQPKGEWLRFATPFNSMIDTDGVPHLPKIGKALGLNFLETYWSYPEAIFHPHNEFIVMQV